MSSPVPSAPRSDRAASGVSRVPPSDALDPLDLLIILGRHRKMLVIWPLVVAVVAAAVSLVLPQTFTAVTRILPPQQAQSSAAMMLSQLGGIAAAAGSTLGLKNPNDLYVGMLKSDAVADALIERFRLKEVYREKLQVDVRKALAQNSRFALDKSGIMEIEVDAREAGLAADLANAYVEQLHHLTSTLAVTEAAQRRVFFEHQLLESKEKLADAELKLRQGIETGGLVSVDAQSRATVETVARLRAQISAKEIQINGLRAYATASNPDVKRLEMELSSMRQELSRLESGKGARGAPEPAGAGAKEATTGVDNIRLVREVKYREVMFELLAKQYEMARVDESKEAPIVQVMDRATPPERRSWPKRTLIVVTAAAAALFSAVVAIFAKDALAIAARDPARQDKLGALRAAWRRRP
ncbi:MAG: Wzz/FepE/Etk N-terminal domain-containing protein [Myxococcales bacterium]